jgi:hypothetical protein
MWAGDNLLVGLGFNGAAKPEAYEQAICCPECADVVKAAVGLLSREYAQHYKDLAEIKCSKNDK